ncbi:MAG: hypothetical protein K8R99_04225 [Actinomycetia bacterium]|nr:hypothetical protein [Actinomycetes bacterium]
MNRALTFLVGMSIASATLVACGDSAEKKAADFCTVVEQTATAQQAIVALLNSGEAPPPAEVKTSLDTFRRRLSEMSAAAPEVLADDMILVVNGFTAFDLGLQKVEYDYLRLLSDDAAAEQAQADMAAMDAPETQDAMAAVDDYALANCGIALDTSGD